MTRGAATNQRMRDERREQILAAGLRVFAARGLAATKIGDIARAAGISHGLLYHYFRSKEDVYLEIIRGALERMNAAALGLERSPLAPADKIRIAFRELVRGFEENEDAARTFLLIAEASASEATPAAVRAVIEKQRRIPYQVVARILKAGQRSGSIRKGDPEELSLLFWVIVRGLAVHRTAWGSAFRAPDLSILTRVFCEER